MKFCGKCGQPIKAEAEFCGKCGMPVKKNVNETVVLSEEIYTPPQARTPAQPPVQTPVQPPARTPIQPPVQPPQPPPQPQVPIQPQPTANEIYITSKKRSNTVIICVILFLVVAGAALFAEWQFGIVGLFSEADRNNNGEAVQAETTNNESRENNDAAGYDDSRDLPDRNDSQTDDPEDILPEIVVTSIAVIYDGILLPTGTEYTAFVGSSVIFELQIEYEARATSGSITNVAEIQWISSNPNIVEIAPGSVDGLTAAVTHKNPGEAALTISVNGVSTIIYVEVVEEIVRLSFDITEINNIISRRTSLANVAVAVIDLQTRESESTANGDVRFVSAGFYVPIFNLALAYEPRVRNQTTDTMMSGMNNASANSLIAGLGGFDRVNQRLRDLGFSGTTFARNFGDTAASARGIENYTTALDAVSILAEVYDNGGYSLMNVNLTREGITIPSGARFYAHRGTGIGGAFNIFAIVDAPTGNYAVAILTRDLSTSNATRILSELLEYIHQQFERINTHA